MLPPEVTNLQLPWPARPLRCKSASMQQGSLMLCCAPAASRGKEHFAEVCRLLVSLSCSASLDLLSPP